MTRVPRNGRVLLAGLPWLARMIDKVRGLEGGSLTDYEFPCGMDRELLNHLNLSPESFLQIVKNSENGQDPKNALQISGRDQVVLRALSLPESPDVDSVGRQQDRLFTSIFLVRNSRLLNQLEQEESPVSNPET